MFYTIKALNSDLIKDRKVGNLTADVASGASVISIDNFSVFADDDYLLVGNFGEPTAEVVQINDAAIDATITLQVALVHDHYVDTPVTILKYNQVQFYDTATESGSLATIGSATNIQADRLYTELYTEPNASALYWSYKWQNGAVFSEAEQVVLYSGYLNNSIYKIAERGRGMANVNSQSEFATDAQLIADCNSAQSIILEVRDGRTGVPINWSFELTKDDTSIATTENENQYLLSSLTSEIKHPDSSEAILNVRFGSGVLEKLDPNEMDELYEGIIRTEVKTGITALDTSIVLDDTYELAESGTIIIGEDTITYTGNTQSTGTLTGCTGVANNHLVDAAVWQGVSPGTPTKYTIFNGNVILDLPVETSKVGYKLKIKYLKKLSVVDSLADVTPIPFYNIIEWYCAARIEYRKGNTVDGDRYMAMFSNGLNNNIKRYKLPPLDEYEYYKFSNGAI
jgi:hypothetical protein